MNLNQNHFELFGLTRDFQLDAQVLDARYRDLQREVHPDRFATAPEAERRLSMQCATRVNEAYRTLKSPLARARYLLELQGVDLETGTNTAMPAAFLAEQMEWREGLEEADRLGDACSLTRLKHEVAAEMDKTFADLAAQLHRGENEAAAGTVRKLMFFDRLAEEVADTRDRYTP